MIASVHEAVGLFERVLEFLRQYQPIDYGRAAAAVGLLGVVLSLFWSISYALRSSSIARLSAKAGVASRRLRRRLGLAAAPDQPITALSPDGFWQWFVDRLDDEIDLRISAVRFLAYAPLLIGLIGTMIALPNLIESYLKEGRTPAASAEELARAFDATIGGVSGSLAAALFVVVLGRVAGVYRRVTERYVHEVVVPSIPERKIAVRVEEAILERVAERATIAVDSFRTALEPLAEHLSRNASAAGSAAEKAAGAFAVAAAALEGAGDIEKAALFLRDTAQVYGSSSANMRAATEGAERLVSEQGALLGRLEESRRCLSDAGEGLGRVAARLDEILVGGLERHRESVSDLATTVGGLSQEVSSVSTEFRTLSENIARRNEVETERVDHATAAIGQLHGAADRFGGAAAAMRDELEAVRLHLERFLGEAARELRTEMGEQLHVLSDRLSDVLERIRGELPHLAADARAAGARIREDVDAARMGLPQLTQALHRLDGQLESFGAHADRLVVAYRELGQTLPRLPTDSLGEIRDGLLSAQASLDNLVEEIKWKS